MYEKRSGERRSPKDRRAGAERRTREDGPPPDEEERRDGERRSGTDRRSGADRRRGG
jgi:hypothetical protein